MRQRPNPELDDVLLDMAVDFRDDPHGFVLECFPWGEGELSGKTGPREWQADILLEIKTLLQRPGADRWEAIREAVASGHGVGKSALVAWLILWALSTMEDSKGVVTANTENQLKTKTWAELAKWWRLCAFKSWFEYTATAIFSADGNRERTWRVDMIPWSERNTEAFAGLHNEGRRILLIFDEASAIPDAIWEVAEGALTDERTEIIWAVFGNPTRNTGRFKQCFSKFRHRWRIRHIDARTVDGTNKTQLQEWVDDYGENSDFVKVRVRGLFPSTSMRQLIPVDVVDGAYGRQLRPDQYEFAPKILTLDPAWTGEDELVIGLRQGLVFRILWTARKSDNDVFVANKLAHFEDEHEADAVFVDGGHGTGVVSVGATLGRTWQIVWFSGKSIDPGCINKRAEMWASTLDWLKSGGAIPEDRVLYDDLIGPELLPRMDGKKQLEAKEDMRRRGLPSPGRGDALALSFAFPVTKRARGRASAGPVVLDGDYDPYS